ncbi:MAG: sulfotransferase [Candidatus Hodarchaeota archaeon]
MKEKKRYFFLVGLHRSGSTLLAYVLNSHSQIHVEHEDDSRPFTQMKERDLYNLKYKIAHGFKNYLDSFLISKNYLITSRYYDIRQIELINSALGNEARYIILTRKHMWRVFYNYKNDPVLLPFWQIRKFMICKYYVKHFCNSIEVSYSNMVSKPEFVFSNICNFIGVDYEPKMLNYHKFDHSNLNNRGNIKTRKFRGIVDKSSQEKISIKMVIDVLKVRFGFYKSET